ncbi:uncharacterized protein V6R79_020844 [Siganus canaliculatus]
MSWQGYVESLMADGNCQDAAIVGYTDNKSVWAAHPGGIFQNITVKEIDTIVQRPGEDRAKLFCNGLTLGSKKCSLIRDELFDDSSRTMDLRIKMEGQDGTCSVTVGRATTALVLVLGKSGIRAGPVNKKAYDMAKYLKEANL